LSGRLQRITCEDIRPYRNTGGFEFLGTDRTKIKSISQIKAVKDVVTQYQLDGLIIIGGDDSNTNATVLAHHLFELNCTVVGVPKTIDGDMQLNQLLPITFGFDTATKFYSHLVGNLMTDSKSVKKYWHFVKLMGRDTSHVALEVALQTHPTLTLLTEEMIYRQASLEMIIDDIIDLIKYRSENGLHHGVVIIPEGLIVHISKDISTFISNYDPMALMQQQDDHGHHPISAIQTEVLLGRCIELKLAQTNIKFQPRYHAFGYEGRCSPPSPFDSWYGYQLGLTAASLVLGGHTGYLASLSQLSTGGMPVGIPLMRLFDDQLDSHCSSGVQSAVIKRVPVGLHSPAFRFFNSRRDHWGESDCFSCPGPLDANDKRKILPRSVALNQGYTDCVVSP
jgi:pyrophosphate--fructose-6-phosphate 1-phosphotransferase